MFYTGLATDPNNDPLAFSISGGPDAALFRITAAGGLSFLSPPDFETPLDADRNNTYLIQVTVSDGLSTAAMPLSITVTDANATTNYRTRRVITGLSTPSYLKAVPDGSGRLFIVEKGGLIKIVTPSTGQVNPNPFLDVVAQISSNDDRGLLGFALAPDFRSSGIFYVTLTNPSGALELRRYRVRSSDRDQAEPTSADVLLQIAPNASVMIGGWIDFGPDGLLYLATGTQEPIKPVGHGGNAQNLNSLLGKVLRLDVNSDAFPADPNRDYAIPASNPVLAGTASEIWAYGLRSPYHGSFDKPTGYLYLDDVGAVSQEVNRMGPSDGGANFGWPFYEGNEPNGPPPGITVPVIYGVYIAPNTPNGSDVFSSQKITGGLAYRGPIEALQGSYFFGDQLNGKFWSVQTRDLMSGISRGYLKYIVPLNTQSFFKPDVGQIDRVASFGEDESDNLYIADFDGEIFITEQF